MKYEMQGIVYTNFVVDADGRISNISIESGEFQLLNQESIRVIQKMPR
ncbi:MAG: energy transducer TonB [Crocinitomicaceae bacterium]|nr:energy transducer TonB [Crocinitomicaceae bacterium]